MPIQNGWNGDDDNDVGDDDDDDSKFYIGIISQQNAI